MLIMYQPLWVCTSKASFISANLIACSKHAYDLTLMNIHDCSLDIVVKILHTCSVHLVAYIGDSVTGVVIVWQQSKSFPQNVNSAQKLDQL